MWLQLIRDLSVLVATPCFSWAWTNHDGFRGPQTRPILLDAIPTVHQLKSWYLVQGCIIMTSTFFCWTYPLFQDFCSTFTHSLGHYCLYRFWSSRAPLISVARHPWSIPGDFQKLPVFLPNKGSQGPKGFFLEIVVLNQWIHIDHYWSL